MRLIAITGGIGSGKSIVASMVKVMGHEVYDCDSRARQLMECSDEVKRQITDAFGPEAYLNDGTLNREHLSHVAFRDAETLSRLNAIVHPATASDLLRWASKLEQLGATAAFVETALLRTAALDRVVDEVWHVTAPTAVRVMRVMARNGITEQQVLDRIASQRIEEAVAPGEHVIVNDGVVAVLPQVFELLKQQ